MAESWIAQCFKQLWKFTPFLQKITHQNHFHQHFFCILPLFSLQITYSFVLPSAVRCTFTSPSLSFKHGLEIYSETLKPTWLLMWVTGHQKQALMQSAGGWPESPLLVFYTRDLTCLLSSSSPKDTGWFIAFLSALSPKDFYIFSKVFTSYKNGNFGQWKHFWEYALLGLAMRYPVLARSNGEGKIKQMETSATWLRGRGNYCMATVRGRSLWQCPWSRCHPSHPSFRSFFSYCNHPGTDNCLFFV